ITDEAATLIAYAADGGMRDALSILDLCASSSKDITEDTVLSVCAMAGNKYLTELSGYIKNCDCENALLTIDKLHNSSVDMQRLLNELISHYRNLMIIKTVKNSRPPIVCSASQLKALQSQAADYDIRDIMRTLSILQASTAAMQTGNRRCEMEMAIIKICNPQALPDINSLEKRIRSLESGAVTLQENKEKVMPETKEEVSEVKEDLEEIPLPNPPEDIISEELPKENKKPASIAKEGSEISEVENWPDIIKILRTSCPPIAGVLENSKAYIKKDYLLIDAPNGMFRSLINSENSGYKDAIRSAAQTVLGAIYKLGPYRASMLNEKEDDDPLSLFAENLKNFEI
ncbi:MAG: hypothetical protein II802_03005, partial [Clostridia bacterium]|nr:hypothetical protein [Clostridia bacterium]